MGRLLSIVIVSWNTRAFLSRCLQAVRDEVAALPAGAVETTVVDNASSDDSVAMVARDHPAVTLIANDRNLGFARACNQAIRVSSGKYVLLLNPDCELQPSALATLIAVLDDNPKVAAAGARLLDSDGGLQQSCSRFPTLGRELYRLFHLDRLRPWACYPMAQWPASAARAVDCVQGACMILRAEALQAVGLLDEDYFIYTEEVDLCRRLCAGGWLTYWVPGAVALHHGGRSTAQAEAPMFLQLYRSKVLYFRKHHGPATASLYKGVLALAAVGRLALLPVAAMETDARRARHLRLGTLYRQLLRGLPGL